MKPRHRTRPFATLLAVGATAAGFFNHPGLAQTAVLTTPVGVMTESMHRGASGLAFPLIGDEVFVGIAVSNGGADVTFPADGPAVAGRVAPGVAYYLEVLTGALEGERLDLDAQAPAGEGNAVNLVFGESTHSTLPALPDGALAGARCSIRAHITLAKLQQSFTPALRGDNHFIFADGVYLLGERGFEFFHLRADHEMWVKPGSGTDVRHRVIPPDVSVLLALRSGNKDWKHTGLVRTNAFRKNLVKGLQAFASGFPADLSPIDIGAFADPAAPAATRWTGHNVFVFADQIEVLFSQHRALALYYLRGDGTTWRTLRSPANAAGSDIIGATDMLVVRRVRPDPEY